MRALITGGAGFVGSHLCERFLREGWEVVALDNFASGAFENISARCGGNDRMRFQFGNVCDPLRLGERFDAVLHFASPASPKDYAEHPIRTLKANSLGTLNCLELARCQGAAFVLASSSEVYGDATVYPQPEEYWGNVNPNGPRSMYDEGKRFSEALAMAYARTHGMRVRIARIFNTYGPRMRPDDGRALPNMICQALRGEPLTVYGDGSQTRSFCYVADLCEAVLRLTTLDGLTPAVVNLGNADEVTILQMAEEILFATGSPRGIRFQPLPQDDPHRRCPDARKAHELLGWAASTPRSEGLRLTVDYFRARLGRKEELSAWQRSVAAKRG